MKYVLLRGRTSGRLYVFTNHPEVRREYHTSWEVLAESDDEQVLLTMLELTKEGE